MSSGEYAVFVFFTYCLNIPQEAANRTIFNPGIDNCPWIVMILELFNASRDIIPVIQSMLACIIKRFHGASQS
jgi:hypothetical protein